MPPKPHMFNMSRELNTRILIKALVFAFGSTFLFYKFHNQRRRRTVEEFNKNYDIDKEFERMRAKGLFSAC